MNEKTVVRLEDTSKAAPLFAGWPDTCIISCLQKVMGDIFVTDSQEPRSAMAFLGGYAFFGGEPERALVEARPGGELVMVPLSEGWARLIEETLPDAARDIRYAMKKAPGFDRQKLTAYAASLPEGYELRPIEGELLDKLLSEGGFSNFGSRERFISLGRGFAVMKGAQIAACASSFSRYREGIEVDVFTAEHERRKGLACAACAKLILSCVDDGLYPNWDAANMNSVRLAQKLGYELDRAYVSYVIQN